MNGEHTSDSTTPLEVPADECQMMANLLDEASLDGVNPVTRAMAMYMAADSFLREHGIIIHFQTN